MEAFFFYECETVCGSIYAYIVHVKVYFCPVEVVWCADGDCSHHTTLICSHTQSASS